MTTCKRRSKFNLDVLKETDENGDVIEGWCTRGFKEEEALCVVCNTVISCVHHGSSAVKRHAVTKRHQDKCKPLRDSSGKLKKQAKSQTFLMPSETSQLWNTGYMSHKDKVTIAETKFAIAVSVNNISYSSGGAMADLFPHIFDDSAIAKDFSCNRNKLSYVISDGLGPYFKEQVINEIFKTQCYFSLQVDETPIPEKRCQQMDILVRYYSETKKQLVCEHLNSILLGSATSDVMLQHVTDSMSLLPQDKLLCFFSDGPNVMKSLHAKLLKLHKHILNVGTCSLHKVHNAFICGLSTFNEVEEFCLDIYYFFKQSAVKSEQLKEIQLNLDLPEHIFLRHVQNRWLTLNLAIERIIEQYKSLESFFLKSQPDRNMRINTDRFLRIQRLLKSKTFFAKLLFIKNFAELFSGFLKLFQHDGPFLHILYDEITELIKKILGRFLQPEAFRNISGNSLQQLNLEKNLKKKIEIGLNTENALKNASENETKNFYKNAETFYKKCAQKLIKTMPLSNTFLKCLRCLHYVCKTETFTVQDIKYIASQLPNIILPCEVSSVTDEWLMYQSEDIDFSVFKTGFPETTEREFLPETNFIRLDVYWTYVFDLKDRLGAVKFPLLSKLIKALLSIPHGNAEVERGFSENKHLLASRSQMKIATINGLRHIKSYMKRYDGDCRKLNINYQMLKSVRQAHQKYRSRVETESVKRKENETSNDVTELEDLLKKKEMIRKNLDISQKMLGNAEELISKGISQKDFSKVQSGQAILQDSKLKIDQYMKDLKEKDVEIDAMKRKRRKI